MPTAKRKPDFATSESGLKALHDLTSMATDVRFETQAGYSTNTGRYPNNLIPFVDKHMLYLQNHPAINPEHYIANLKLMTKK